MLVCCCSYRLIAVEPRGCSGHHVLGGDAGTLLTLDGALLEDCSPHKHLFPRYLPPPSYIYLRLCPNACAKQRFCPTTGDAMSSSSPSGLRPRQVSKPKAPAARRPDGRVVPHPWTGIAPTGQFLIRGAQTMFT
jgi:hypothetical protein